MGLAQRSLRVFQQGGGAVYVQPSGRAPADFKVAENLGLQRCAKTFDAFDPVFAGRPLQFLQRRDAQFAWREGDSDYATVAMRFSLNEETLDRDSGRVVQGGPDEATEVRTFMRVRGGHWLVSAIQQS
jgi:hypothetical protein